MSGLDAEEITDKRGGLGPLLTSLRMLFENPATRNLLRVSTRKAVCKYGNYERRDALIYHALSQLAGETTTCPLATRMITWLIRSTIKAGVWLLKGDMDKAREALSDPAVRRGITLVFKGLAYYGVTVPQKLPAPFLIVWNFTNMCNLRCMHCYQRADKPTPDELTLEEKLDVVDQLDKAGVAAVALSGGEPTIHPHFLRVVRELSDRGIYTAVATNGIAFSRIGYFKRAVKAGLRYVEISLDSSKPERHDRFRGVSGAWKHAVKALENAVKLGVNHSMAVTITKFNVDEVGDILDLAESLGVKRVIFFNFIPVGRGEENAWMDLDPEEREEVLRTLYREHKRRGIEIASTAPQYGRVALQLSGGREIAPTHFYLGEDKIVKALAEFIGGCGAGRIYAAIQPNGDVTPCVFFPVKVGSLREKSFMKIWEGSELFKKLRNRELLKGICGRCPYKYICGGCRARAYAYYEDPLAPDPGCILNKREWDKISGKHKIKVRIPNRRVHATNG